jgi:hypothetical protein
MPDNEDDNSNYPVGYKKPPQHTQFKSGQSGNARGRPKGSRNFATVFDQELNATIPVTENGKRRKISKREAIVKQTVNKAAAGDQKATTTILNEARLNENQNQLPFAQAVAFTPEDQLVITDIVQRIRQADPVADAPTAAPDSPIEIESTAPIQSDKDKGAL